jgi:hypothetical protein
MLLQIYSKTRSALLGGANLRLLFKQTNISSFFFQLSLEYNFFFLKSGCKDTRSFWMKKNFQKKKQQLVHGNANKSFVFIKIFFQIITYQAITPG